MIETDIEVIRRGFASLFKGETSLPMNVTAIPGDPEAAERQKRLQTALAEWLDGRRAVKTSNVPPE